MTITTFLAIFNFYNYLVAILSFWHCLFVYNYFNGKLVFDNIFQYFFFLQYNFLTILFFLIIITFWCCYFFYIYFFCQLLLFWQYLFFDSYYFCALTILLILQYRKVSNWRQGCAMMIGCRSSIAAAYGDYWNRTLVMRGEHCWYALAAKRWNHNTTYVKVCLTWASVCGYLASAVVYTVLDYREFRIFWFILRVSRNI